MSAKSVRQSVAQFKGHVTWEYSQGDWSTWKIIATNSVSRWGICKALSAQWIVDHAYGGTLVKRVVGANGHINESAIRKIKQDFIDSTSPGRDQRALTAQWLLERGVLRRGKSVCFNFERPRNGIRFKGQSTQRGDMGMSSTGKNNNAGLPLEIAKALRAIAHRERRVRMGGSYVQIDFGGKGMGHAVAAWVAQDALFYDPNNGEYWFENADHFCDWFPTYYTKAGYDSFTVKFLYRWNVEEYALAVRSAARAS